MTDLATLKIVVDANGAIRVVDQFGKATEVAAKKVDKLEQSAKRVGKVVGGVFVAGLALAVKETVDAQREQALLANIIRTTGEAAGRSLKQLNEHADALRRVTAFGGGDISDAQRRLLSYTEIVGANFDRATLAVLNFSQEFGVGTVQAAEAVGKALNYPTLGLGLLSKQGFIFTESQKKQIEYFEQTNQLARAQAIILEELESVINGSATAYRNTLGGALEAVRESFVDLFEVSSPGMTELIEDVNILADTLATIPTHLAIMAENFRNVRLQFDSFFDFTGGKRGRGVNAAVARLEGRAEPPTAAEELAASNALLEGLRQLLADQQKAIVDAAVARARPRPGAPPGPPPADDPFDVEEARKAFRTLREEFGPFVDGLTGSKEQLEAIGKVLRESVSDSAKAFADNVEALEERIGATRSGFVQSLDATERFNEGIDLTREGVRNLGPELRSAGAGFERLTEAARVFEEQTQIALGRFFSDFLRDGFSSIGAFWDDFKQLGRDALGNLFAQIVMERVTSSGIGGRIADRLGTGGIVGLGFVGAIIGSFTAAADRARELAAAFAAVRRSIRDFGAQATDTPEQAALRSLQNTRDDLARQAVAATGIKGFTGGLAEAQAFLAQYGDILAVVKGDAAIDKLRAALGKLEEAFEANVEAAKRAAEAAEAQARANQRVALTQFRDSLLLSGQSTLSPTAQLAEARRQYDAILGLAKGGDASAIDSLPETARTLLDASRAVFASGARYADEFNRVTADVNAIIKDLAPTKDVEFAQLEVQQEGFTGMIERMDTLIARIEAVDYTLRTGVIVEDGI